MMPQAAQAIVAPVLETAVSSGLAKAGVANALGKFNIKIAAVTTILTTMVLDKGPALLGWLWNKATAIFQGKKEKNVVEKQETEALRLARQHEAELDRLRAELARLAQSVAPTLKPATHSVSRPSSVRSAGNLKV